MISNIIAAAIILMIAGGAATYIIKAKKRGETCIGCPYAKQCKSSSKGSCASHK